MARKTTKVTRSKTTNPTAGKSLLAEVGAVGLRQFGGYVYEEILPQLQGQNGVRTFKEMALNDATVSAILFAVNMFCRQVPVRVSPAGAQPTKNDALATTFIDQCLQDMSMSWQDTLSEVLSMLQYGWAWHEIVYKIRGGPDTDDPTKRSQYNDGRVGWRKWALRSQDSLLRWDIDNYDGTVRGMFQLAPPLYQLTYVPIEKSLLFRTKPAKGNPEGESILRHAYTCHSDDTDVLTRSGWKSITEITLDDSVATLNPETNELFYQQPTELYSYPYHGEMVHVSSRFLDMLITPNHNVWVRHAHTDEWKMEEVADVPVTAHYKRDADWSGEEREYFTLPAITVQNGGFGGEREHPDKEIPMDDWLRFFGIWIAEGHTYRGKTGKRQAVVSITQKRSGSQFEDIQTWVNALGFKVQANDRHDHEYADDIVNLRISSLQLYEYLKQFGKSHDKFVPQFIKELPPRQIRIFLDAYYAGDGTYGTTKRHDHDADRDYRRTPYSFTVSKRLADDISELILKVGNCPSLAWKKGNGFGAGIWRTTEGKRFANGCRPSKYELVDYHGDVYCLTVPKHHLIYTRRNGKSCWGGNSWYRKKNIEEMEAVGIERDLAGYPIIRVPEKVWNRSSLEDQASFASFENISKGIHRNESEGLILPSSVVTVEDGVGGVTAVPGTYKYDVQLITAGSRRQFDTNTIINRYNYDIARVMLADVIMIGGSDVGSYALTTKKSEMFIIALGAILDSIADIINSFAIPRLMHLNAFPQLSGNPQVQFGPIAKQDIQQLAQSLLFLQQAGAEPFGPGSDELQKYIFEEMDLPVKQKVPQWENPNAEELEQPGTQSEEVEGA